MSAELIRPILTVDVVLVTLKDSQLHIVLQKRDKPPHAGRPALIGGYVRPEEDESTSAAAARVLRDKVGLTVRLLEQLMTFSGTKRDPRGWSASVAYYALLPAEDVPASPRSPLTMLPLDRANGLPFDHDVILAKAAERWRRRAAYSSLPAFLLPSKLRQLHTERLLSHPIYVVRQGAYLVRLSAGMCWGADPKVREYFALAPYPADPGTFRTS